jgi:hypothetical protein
VLERGWRVEKLAVDLGEGGIVTLEAETMM